MSLWRLPRESTEWVGPLTVTVDGEPVTTFEVAYLPYLARPVEDDWTTPTVLDGAAGVLVTPVTEASRHAVWVRVTDHPEIPVLDNVATVWRT